MKARRRKSREADFNAALKFGHECCQPLIEAQKKLMAVGGKKKRDIKVEHRAGRNFEGSQGSWRATGLSRRC